MAYGKELILDLHNCDVSKFTRNSIEGYFIKLCELIDMQRCEMFWWDDSDTPENEKQTSPHTKGTSAIQFILTSNITIHTLDILKNVYLNVFSCKEFSEKIAVDFSVGWFCGIVANKHVIERI